jgi:hypothetical protein
MEQCREISRNHIKIKELQSQVDSEHKAWELMTADRDLWKSRCNEPYDESVIAENIKLQAQVGAILQMEVPTGYSAHFTHGWGSCLQTIKAAIKGEGDE